MFELFFLIALIGAVVILPLVLVGLVLKLLFHLVILPFQLLGAVIGLGVTGLVLGLLAIVFGSVIGLITLAGALVAGIPILVVGLIAWGLIRLIRRDRKMETSV